ncbi:MBL fold metallo-hydrolase [Corynebacterium kroppenstedtii]|uniref:MBL fold metallo-hydrolase n=1 Tax=Corynebacterium sp. PCR 32 TaxID=3351342 RepID=UPI0037520A11
MSTPPTNQTPPMYSTHSEGHPPRRTKRQIPLSSYTGHIDKPRQAQRLTYNSPYTPDSDASDIPPDNNVSIIKTSVGPMDNSCYLLAVNGDAVLIDAATDAPFLLDLADAAELTITDIITTHSHHDHVGALREVIYQTGARHHASRGDAPELPAEVNRTVGDGSPLDLAGSSLHRLQLRGITLHGHTSEGLAVVFDPSLSLGITAPTHIFTGDSLFPGGVGKTTSQDDFTLLFNDVTTKLFDVYADSTWVHPGHGDDTTLGTERPHLDEWRQRGW